MEAGVSAEEEGALVDVIRAHIEYALTDDDMAHLFSPAPPEYWRRFWAGEPQGMREIPLAVPSAGQPAPPCVSMQRATAHAA